MNMQALMAQAQKMQKDIAKKKEEIDRKLFPGKSEWVELTFNGQRKLMSFSIIKKDILPEEIEMLEDMITIAINDSLSKITAEVENQLGAYGGGLSGLM